MNYKILSENGRKTHVHYLADGALSLERKTFWDVGALYRFQLFLEEKFEAIKIWKERIEARRNLARLSDRALEDIGLTRADVEREVIKGLWQM